MNHEGEKIDPREVFSEVEDETPSCPICGGPLYFIGTLGNLNHFNCRNCGAECSSSG